MTLLCRSIAKKTLIIHLINFVSTKAIGRPCAVRDDYEVDTISVTKLLAAKSQLTSPHMPSSYFSMLEDMINLPFHTIPLIISQL